MSAQVVCLECARTCEEMCSAHSVDAWGPAEPGVCSVCRKTHVVVGVCERTDRYGTWCGTAVCGDCADAHHEKCSREVAASNAEWDHDHGVTRSEDGSISY